jgi:hypothetical protein
MRVALARMVAALRGVVAVVVVPSAMLGAEHLSWWWLGIALAIVVAWTFVYVRVAGGQPDRLHSAPPLPAPVRLVNHELPGRRLAHGKLDFVTDPGSFHPTDVGQQDGYEVAFSGQ